MASKLLKWIEWCPLFVEALQKNRLRRVILVHQLNAMRNAVGRGKMLATLTNKHLVLHGDFSAGIPKQTGSTQTQSELIDAHK